MTAKTERRRSWWGWGWEDEAITGDQLAGMAKTIAARFPGAEVEPSPPPTLETITIPDPAVSPPAALAGFCSTDRYDRAAHTYGRSYRDVVRAFRGDFTPAPAFVAFPRPE